MTKAKDKIVSAPGEVVVKAACPCCYHDNYVITDEHLPRTNVVRCDKCNSMFLVDVKPLMVYNLKVYKCTFIVSRGGVLSEQRKQEDAEKPF